MAAMLVGTASASRRRMGPHHQLHKLVFKYSAQRHDVVEVNKAVGYDSCSTSTSIATHTIGNDVIPLTSTGTATSSAASPATAPPPAPAT
uniref:Phytocyanin domain-containing protein n=1 Tax=Oryza meridionalis TaxID=40149 RepID=A0A0E0EDV0_9ORYZ